MTQKQAIKRVIDLYGNTGWKSLFTKWKFWEEPYTELEKLMPKKGKIVDLGCGEGIFDNFLALTSDKRKIFGFEVAKDRVNIADRGVAMTQFKVADITKLKIPTAEALVMFHVLHHLRSERQQDMVLKKCYQSLGKGGKLFVVEVEIKFSFKYWICWLFDYFFVPWVFEGKFYTRAYFRKSTDWKKYLESLGFKTKIIPADAHRPFSNVILENTHP